MFADKTYIQQLLRWWAVVALSLWAVVSPSQQRLRAADDKNPPEQASFNQPLQYSISETGTKWTSPQGVGGLSAVLPSRITLKTATSSVMLVATPPTRAQQLFLLYQRMQLEGA